MTCPCWDGRYCYFGICPGNIDDYDGPEPPECDREGSDYDCVKFKIASLEHDGDGNDVKERTALTNGETVPTNYPDYMLADSDGYCLITGKQVFENTYRPIYENGKLVRTEITTKRMFIQCNGYCHECEIYKEYKKETEDMI